MKPGSFQSGPAHPRWRGGRRGGGRYWRVLVHGHPEADEHGYVLEHRLVAERALGKYLPAKAEVHHVNGDSLDNHPSNLVICQDRAYHFLLHQRKRALEACGNPSLVKCPFCKQYDDPANMHPRGPYNQRHHKQCACDYASARREGKR